MQHGGDHTEGTLEPIQHRIEESREEDVHLASLSAALEGALWVLDTSTGLMWIEGKSPGLICWGLGVGCAEAANTEGLVC